MAASRSVRRLSLPLLLALFILFPTHVAAHPLGNFSVNRYSRLTVETNAIRILYVLDMAEIPTFQAAPRVDVDRNGTIDAAEHARYRDRLEAEILANVRLEVDGRAHVLQRESATLTFPDGQGGLQTTRLELELAATLAPRDARGTIEYEDLSFADRVGWQEIVLRGGDGIRLLESTVPTSDLSDALRRYPEARLAAPPRVSHASATFAPGATTNSAAGSAAVGGPVTARGDEGMAALIERGALGSGTLLLALVAAFGWGAAHSLSPGHGKSVVGAYLVGSRGTVRHAIFLGLTTTITHTAGVFALGFVTLFLSRFILPETLYPWLGTLSGLLVVGIGLTLFRSRARALRHRHHHHPHDHGHHHHHGHAREHDDTHAHHHHTDATGAHAHAGTGHHADHGHHHLPPGADGEPITWRSLLALGISGGLLPCPSALVVLLSAIALQRVGLGLLLILAFSLGLASVLTAFGILMVHAQRLFERIPSSGRLMPLVPAASAFVITLAGLGITLQALAQTGTLDRLALLALPLF